MFCSVEATIILFIRQSQHYSKVGTPQIELKVSENKNRTNYIFKSKSIRFILYKSQLQYMERSAQKVVPNQKKTSLLFISLMGSLRGIIGLPLQHPFDALKTWMQSENIHFRAAAEQIYQKKGLKGFYSGFLINSLRVMSKQAYRWPLNVYLISNLRKQFKGINYSNTLAGVVTGLMTAWIESAIICPFQRIKVWLMTTKQVSGYSHFLKLSSLKTLFNGFTPVVAKQTLSWVSFLGSQEYFKQVIYKYRNKSPEQYELTNQELILISLLVCLVNTIFVMPVDYIKTHFQRFENSNKRLHWLQLMRQTYQKHGVKGFYRGGSIKIVQYNINSLMTVPIFEKLLRSYN